MKVRLFNEKKEAKNGFICNGDLEHEGVVVKFKIFETKKADAKNSWYIKMPSVKGQDDNYYDEAYITDKDLFAELVKKVEKAFEYKH